MKNKKYLAMLLCTTMILAGGCGVNNKKEEIEKASENKETVEKSETVKLSEFIPDPEEYFFNTKFEYITNDDSYTVYMDYVTAEEWNSYIEKCKEEGFWTNESYQSEFSWYTSSSDGKYELMLDRYGDQNVYMTILVKEVKEYEK